MHGFAVRPGRPAPLGATWDGQGVNFAVYSENATAVELCLFEAQPGKGGEGALTERRTFLPGKTQRVFHGYVPGIGPGQLYGLRAFGPYEPKSGHRFNPHKLLVDPYARAIFGKADHRAPLGGYTRTPKVDESTRDEQDSAGGVPKGVVVDGAFDWQGDTPPAVRWRDTILYELHVKGFTRRMPGVPEAERGTYLGLASDAAIAHLRGLGVTAVELLPIHDCMDEPHVARRGMINYWGYSTLGFFAPEQRYATRADVPGLAVREFKEMVRRLHAAGIEVLLDVVYNHSCEGDSLGPTVSLRGLDNAVYYRLKSGDPSRYEDPTGCGNSLDLRHPQVLKLVMDSLRYWVTEMHVDGFRFDLATTLAREDQGYDRGASFLDAVHQDPVLSQVKLVAEPWDLGPDGYQVGNFPPLWSEWNGKFRDTVRRFWTGDASMVADLGFRLSGSSDLYQDDGREPQASINFVTAHDGFTLRDLVSYAKKHNEANGENNRDGWDDNASDNCGVEGETSDPEVVARRRCLQRSLLTTLLLAQGVPMITSGDEVGKTQGGNNNPYCLDNEVSWVDWDLDGERRELLAFVADLVRLRNAHPTFRRESFLSGVPVGGSQLKDIAWFRADGREMTEKDWKEPSQAFLGFLLAGDAIHGGDERGPGATDDTFLFLMCGHRRDVRVTLPGNAWGDTWAGVLDTTAARLGSDVVLSAGASFDMTPRSLLLLRRMAPASGTWRPPRRG